MSVRRIFIMDGAEGDLGPVGQLFAELSSQPAVIRAVALRFGGLGLVPLGGLAEEPEQDELDDEGDDEALAEETEVEGDDLDRDDA